jgi:GMP synthase (glutamine-hydrolysing)
MHERVCIAESSKMDKVSFHFVNLLNNRSKITTNKDLSNYSGVIMGGSGQVDISCWSEYHKNQILNVEDIVRKAVEVDMPMLNICFGHQLLAYILGGRVEADEKQAETGTYEISLNTNGRKSPLFEDLPDEFYAVLGHRDTVTKLPPGALLLADSKRCKAQSYKLKSNIYCVQFHPELDKKGMRKRLELFPEYLTGKNVKEMLKSYKDTKYASMVISNFINRVCV